MRRFDLSAAIVDQGTLSIDAYASNTGDYALFNGRRYSDKAPGLSFFRRARLLRRVAHDTTRSRAELHRVTRARARRRPDDQSCDRSSLA